MSGVGRRVAAAVLAALAVTGVAAASGCTQGGEEPAVQTANRAGQEVTSPSGDAVATLAAGPDDGGPTLQVVVTSADGAELFRSDEAYSARHGVALAWQADGEVLWVLSSDVGTSYVRNGADGWTQTWLTPETRGDVPPEIAALR